MAPNGGLAEVGCPGCMARGNSVSGRERDRARSLTSGAQPSAQWTHIAQGLADALVFREGEEGMLRTPTYMIKVRSRKHTRGISC